MLINNNNNKNICKKIMFFYFFESGPKQFRCPDPNAFGRLCPRGVMAKVMNCRIVVSEFELLSCYYVHFRTNTLGKGRNPLILSAMG